MKVHRVMKPHENSKCRVRKYHCTKPYNMVCIPDYYYICAVLASGLGCYYLDGTSFLNALCKEPIPFTLLLTSYYIRTVKVLIEQRKPHVFVHGILLISLSATLI